MQVCINILSQTTKIADLSIYGKNTFKHLLWIQKAIDFGPWYEALEMWAQPSFHKWQS